MWTEISRTLRWTKTSYFLISLFVAVVALIITVWYPLAEEYLAQLDPARPILPQLDWLLIGVFLVMSLLIMGGADWRRDAWIAAVATMGGLTIESWGTQTLLWTYYTNERPPLWIIPAWPIATLAIDRIHRLVLSLARKFPDRIAAAAFYLVAGTFYLIMLWFVAPTFGKTLTIGALVLCAALTIFPGDRRKALAMFLSGAALGYFLELWGTTRECWTYYTRETPPLFAVLAHGMAAFAFARAGEVLQSTAAAWRAAFLRNRKREMLEEA